VRPATSKTYPILRSVRNATSTLSSAVIRPPEPFTLSPRVSSNAGVGFSFEFCFGACEHGAVRRARPCLLGTSRRRLPERVSSDRRSLPDGNTPKRRPSTPETGKDQPLICRLLVLRSCTRGGAVHVNDQRAGTGRAPEVMRDAERQFCVSRTDTRGGRDRRRMRCRHSGHRVGVGNPRGALHACRRDSLRSVR
jgi:hypothetical protein